LLLSALLEGQCAWDQDCRQAINAPGNVVLLDTRRPFLVSAQSPTRSHTFTIPRFELEARLGSIAGLTARTMDVRDPVMGIAAGFLAMLPDRMDAFDGPTSLQIASQALDLVALALSTETQKSVRALSSSRGIALLRLKSVIEARLTDPDLKPGVAATAAGLSVRYANELLSLEGTSIERYIVARRLERCRRALEDPTQMHRTIADIAFNWGFRDLSHFARRFKAAFGLAPRDYRNRRA
jgi:AraC-like DNA-binding protein